MKIIKKILIPIALMAVIFIILDFGYLWANLRFDLGQIPNTATATPLAAASQGAPAPAQVQSSLVIPSLGISAPIVYANEQSESAFEVNLTQGVVHYPQTAMPGQVGNCYIFGHSSDFFWKPGNYKNVFALLPRIKKGAAITITAQSGQIFTYTVTKSFRVAGNDTSVLSQATNGQKILTLQTSYPVGTALARWIVIAQTN